MGLPRTPALAVDALILDPSARKIVLIRRANPPYQGAYALPGGFVEYGETVEQACIREAKEETSLDVKVVDLIGVFSDPDRDPRGHVVSVAFLCVPVGGELRAASDAKKAEWVNIDKLPELSLAFDHRRIIEKGLEKARERGLI